MSDVRDMFEPAHDYLPEDVAADLSLASTMPAWWMRLALLIEADREEIARLKATVETLGQQICQFHDTNPLNETVTELEQARDALEAENRVVRELVEDALDRLWVRDKEYYQRIADRCHWIRGDEEPPNAETVLERLGLRIEVLKVTTGCWEIRASGHRVGIYSFESTAVSDAAILCETIARSVRQATDPLLARIAALTREYQDYMTIADHCAKVYDHFSGGRISKPFTLPEEVIAVAEEIQDEDFEQWGKEHLEVALEPIRTRLEEFSRAWIDARSDDLEKEDLGTELLAWIEETFKETK